MSNGAIWFSVHLTHIVCIWRWWRWWWWWAKNQFEIRVDTYVCWNGIQQLILLHIFTKHIMYTHTHFYMLFPSSIEWMPCIFRVIWKKKTAKMDFLNLGNLFVEPWKLIEMLIHGFYRIEILGIFSVLSKFATHITPLNIHRLGTNNELGA